MKCKCGGHFRKPAPASGETQTRCDRCYAPGPHLVDVAKVDHLFQLTRLAIHKNNFTNTLEELQNLELSLREIYEELHTVYDLFGLMPPSKFHEQDAQKAPMYGHIGPIEFSLPAIKPGQTVIITYDHGKRIQQVNL